MEGVLSWAVQLGAVERDVVATLGVVSAYGLPAFLHLHVCEASCDGSSIGANPGVCW